MFNVIADIYLQKLTADNKYEYSLAVEKVEIILVPVSREIIALYPDIPVGQTYSYFIIVNNSPIVIDDTIKVPPQSKFVIRESFINSISENDNFITKEASQETDLAGQNVISGICIKI